MGNVRISVEHKGVSHEADFPFHEERNMIGEWHTEDWEAVIRMAVAAVSASVKSTETSDDQP
jgi:hypothetical protein